MAGGAETFAGRREDYRLLVGQGQYTADWKLEGEVHSCFRRSDHARASISAVDISAARKVPGVLAILTGEDIERAGIRLPDPTPAPTGEGMDVIRSPAREVLARRRIDYVGQPVALVIAADPYAAQDAAEMIDIAYSELPAVMDAEAALAEDAPLLDLSVPGNLCFRYEYGDPEATEVAFSAAAHVTTIRLHSQRLIGNPMEPKAFIAAYDPSDGSYDFYCQTQGRGTIRRQFAEGLGVDPALIRIHTRDVGGAFGVRVDTCAEYFALALGARMVGRPVRWVATRSETMVSDYHGRDLTMYAELALDRDGRFLAIRHNWIANAGAFPSASGALVTTVGPSSYLVGPYRTPAIHGLHRVALTNTVPTTPYRGSARPNVSYVIERLIDEAAHETGIDRLELRRRNLLNRSDFPYRTPVGSVYDSGDPQGLLARAESLSDIAGFQARQDAAAAANRLRGLGVAVFIESAGGGRSAHEEADIRFGDDGVVRIHTLAGASGQGHETVFPEIVADILGIPAERVILQQDDPEGAPLIGDGSIGSRSVMAHGSALARTAQQVIAQGRTMAAGILEVPESGLEFRNGIFHSIGTNRTISLDELASVRLPDRSCALDARASVPSPKSFPSGAHVCEVEICRDTGEWRVTRYVAVDDAGNELSPVLVEGQIHGGIVQGFGQVIGEHCRYDSDGQLLSGSFMDYLMPRADIGFPMEVVSYPVPSPNNILGAKGVGEAGTTGALACLSNAVIDALRPLGIRSLDLPYTPDRLWDAIENALRTPAA